MILLTGRGAFAKAFSSQHACKIVSLRSANFADLSRIISGVKVIIHNAANINSGGFIEAVDDNFILTKRILDSVYEINPNIYFIFLSSMSILSNESENRYKNIKEMDSYAYSKYLAETYCLKHPFPNVSVVRFSTLFYADEKRDGLSKLVSDACLLNSVTIFNSGEASRDFIPLKVAARYVYKMINNKDRKKVYNIVSAKATSFSQVVEYLKLKFPTLEVVNKNLDSRPAGVLSKFSDGSISKLGKIDFILEHEINKYIKQLKYSPIKRSL